MSGMIADHISRNDISFSLQSPTEDKETTFTFSEKPAVSTKWLVEQLRVAMTKLPEKDIAIMIEDVTNAIQSIFLNKTESYLPGTGTAYKISLCKVKIKGN